MIETEMTKVFNKLKDLQEILAEKYRLQSLIDDSPRKLAAQDELLTLMKQEYIELNTAYENTRADVLQLKADLTEAESARERGEKGMDNITTHREYEALDKEIKDAAEREQQIRKSLQKEEVNLADLDDKLRQQEELIQTQETELNDGKAKLEQEIDRYKAELDTLISREQELVPGIDPEIIFKFERIIKSKHNKGIVAVKGNVCDGCHMILPAQFANEVHSGDQIVFCPYCSRILYYQETDDDMQYFHMDDTGSLADLDDDFEEEDDDADEISDEHDEIKDFGYDD